MWISINETGRGGEGDRNLGDGASSARNGTLHCVPFGTFQRLQYVVPSIPSTKITRCRELQLKRPLCGHINHSPQMHGGVGGLEGKTLCVPFMGCRTGEGEFGVSNFIKEVSTSGLSFMKFHIKSRLLILKQFSARNGEIHHLCKCGCWGKKKIK
ncbi:hypothetical protein CDAR_383251 [Caerostris darwini]|uniref:Uncharacterized protein n=1 Tax=Caerostris darwini TaxID=1538125 RepID=A0AAV4NVN3_9ARAC|nr:hypothetical protein CDAR_383251 [Caerostris darwini]